MVFSAIELIVGLESLSFGAGDGNVMKVNVVVDAVTFNTDKSPAGRFTNPAPLFSQLKKPTYDKKWVVILDLKAVGSSAAGSVIDKSGDILIAEP